MSTDPRNDRRHDEDCYDDRPCCGICERLVTPASFGAWDRFDVFCASCSTAAERDYPAGDDSLPFDEEYHRPMGAAEALMMAVETVLGARTLLNGGGAHPDDEEEEETVQIEAESMSDLVHGRRGAAA